jgi:hypothetical protein
MISLSPMYANNADTTEANRYHRDHPPRNGAQANINVNHIPNMADKT